MEINILGNPIEIPGMITKEEYNENKRQIESNEKLTFFSYDEDLKIRAKNIGHDSTMKFIMLLALVIVLSILFLSSYLGKNEGLKQIIYLLSVLSLFVVTIIVMLSYITSTLTQYLIKYSLFYFLFH